MRDRKRIVFIGNLGVVGERGDVFSVHSLCPSQSAKQYKDAIKILVEERRCDTHTLSEE